MSTDLEHGRSRLVSVLKTERGKLLRFARSRLDHGDDADDVIADVVLSLFERADLLAQVENITAYLFRAVANAVLDRFRRRRHMEELSEQCPDPGLSPEDEIVRSQLRQRLEDALAKLTPAERAVWEAVELEGRTFRQLSVEWKQPLGTLLSRKSRAGHRLRQLMMETD